jgi:hypothetical protein
MVFSRTEAFLDEQPLLSKQEGRKRLCERAIVPADGSVRRRYGEWKSITRAQSVLKARPIHTWIVLAKLANIAIAPFSVGAQRVPTVCDR